MASGSPKARRATSSSSRIGDDRVLILTSIPAIEVGRADDLGPRIPGCPAKFDRMIPQRDPQQASLANLSELAWRGPDSCPLFSAGRLR